MSKPLKPRRGTTAEQNAFVGEAYEVTYDTDKNTLVCRDGLTAGGFPLARADEVAQKNAAQDAAIAKKVSKVNEREPDENGNVDVGAMPLGTIFPYTGKDVPAGTLRADGATYTGMRAAFPEFYEWVVASGLTVPLADYALVEGSCGYYGLDTSTGTVRMPTLAAGVFGTVEADKYGQAVQAGAPNITGTSGVGRYANWANADGASGALYHTIKTGQLDEGNNATYSMAYVSIDASRSAPVYRDDIDTIQPSHVKYPWVIVVYNAAVPPSVAQAGEFVGLLDGKADKTHLDTVVAPGFVMPFAANSSPAGYLLCNGATVSRTTYAALFSAIGTTYGAGDGSSTFALPNLTDRFIQGSGTAGTVKAAGMPEIDGTYQAARLASAIELTNGAFTYGTVGRGDYGWPQGGYNAGTVNVPYIIFKASRSNSTYGKSNTVQPPALTMRYYIKY